MSVRRLRDSPSPEMHRTPVVLAVRMRDFRVSANPTSGTHDGDGASQWRAYLGLLGQAPLTNPDPAHTDDTFPAPPWLHVTLHRPSREPLHGGEVRVDSHLPSSSTRGTAPQPATSQLASFSSEETLAIPHLQAAAVEWPGFEPSLSLALPALEETPLTQWRALLTQLTVTIALCSSHPLPPSRDEDDGTHITGQHSAHAHVVARCHFTLAQLLLDTYPYQPVRAAFHAVSSSTTRDDGRAAAASALTGADVLFFVEAQQIQTLQVLVTALSLKCPSSLALVSAAQKAAVGHKSRQSPPGGRERTKYESDARANEAVMGTDRATALAAVVPAAGSTLPALFALRVDDGAGTLVRTHIAGPPPSSAPVSTPVCWADRQELSETESVFRWTALPPRTLHDQTLSSVTEEGLQCVVYARTDGADVGASSASSTLAVPCGTIRIALSALVRASVQQSAAARTGTALTTSGDEEDEMVADRASSSSAVHNGTPHARSEPALCSQTFSASVDWLPSAAAAPAAPCVVHGVVDARPAFVYVQNGGAQYPYSEAMRTAAMRDAPIPLRFYVRDAVSSSPPPPSDAAEEKDRDLNSARSSHNRAASAITVPSALADDSDVMTTVLSQQANLTHAIKTRLEAVQREQAAVLGHARERRRIAEAQRAAAQISIEALTQQIAHHQAIADESQLSLDQIRQCIHDKEQQIAEAAAERRLLTSRVASEREELATLRARLVAAHDQMKGDLESLTRQSAQTKARVSGMLMESVLNETDSTPLE